MNIDGAKALVTGGSGGLGTRLCEKLADAGVDVAIGYRSGRDRAETVASSVVARGRRATVVHLDQCDPASVTDAVNRAADALGGLDILVNNAGGGTALPVGDLDALTPEIWDEMMALNVRGPYLVARAAAPRLRESDWGRIVNLGSTIGHGTWWAGEAYAPSKGSVAVVTRFLAAALAPDVTVNCVAPGLMEGTLMTTGISEARAQPWRDRAVLGVSTSIEDVATQVLAFCAMEAVTGQVLVMDGGIHFD